MVDRDGFIRTVVDAVLLDFEGSTPRIFKRNKFIDCEIAGIVAHPEWNPLRALGCSISMQSPEGPRTPGRLCLRYQGFILLPVTAGPPTG